MLSKEEIEKAKRIINKEKTDFQNELNIELDPVIEDEDRDELRMAYLVSRIEAIDTLLQYIDRLEFQTQVKEKEHAYDLNMIDEVKGEAVKLYNKIDKLKKIIDEMSKQLAGIAIWNNEKEEPIILKDEQEVKLYFENKVEEK